MGWLSISPRSSCDSCVGFYHVYWLVGLVLVGLMMLCNANTIQVFPCNIAGTVWGCFFEATMTELLLIEQPLRTYWSLAKFSPKGKRDIDTSHDDDDDDAFRSNLEVLDASIRSTLFWSRCKVVKELAYLGEWTGRWAEGCPCHDAELTAGIKVDCPMKHCRAPELACGQAMTGMDQQVQRLNNAMIPILKNSGISEREQQVLLLQAQKASAHVTSEIKVKFGHWTHLPHILCGLAHWNTEESLKVARRSLELFKSGGPGAHHNMSRRFLDPNWHLQGPGEISFRPYVEAIANGSATVQSVQDESFQHYVAGLSLIKVVERPVEGLHSQISRLLRTSPNATCSLVSNHLRSDSFAKLLESHPEILHSSDAASLERAAGFKTAVEQILSLPHGALNNSSERDAANLLYRDNLRQKHSQKANVVKDLAKDSSLRPKAPEALPITACPMTQMMGAHLVSITGTDPSVFFAVPDDLFKRCMVSLKDIAEGACFFWFF